MQELYSPANRIFTVEHKAEETVIRFPSMLTVPRSAIILLSFILVGIVLIASQYHWIMATFGIAKNPAGVSEPFPEMIKWGLAAVVFGLPFLLGRVHFRFSKTSIGRSVTIFGLRIFSWNVGLDQLTNYDILEAETVVKMYHVSFPEGNVREVMVLEGFRTLEELDWLWGFICRQSSELAILPRRLS